MYRFKRAGACACVLMTMAVAGCGSSSTSTSSQSDGTFDAPGEEASAETTTEQALSAEARLAIRVETVQKCLADRGHPSTIIQPTAMEVPADIQQMVKGSGATVIHLDQRKNETSPDVDDPATDILVTGGAGVPSELGTRVTEWLDERAGLDDSRSAGVGPSSDIAAPTGPTGDFSEALGGTASLSYTMQTATLRRLLEGCDAASPSTPK